MGGSGSRTNLSGLKWSLHTELSPHLWTTATDKGNAGTTDNGGYFDMTFPNTPVAAAGAAWLTVTNSNGSPSQTPAPWTFSAPVTLN